jgi:hypothetical protein
MNPKLFLGPMSKNTVDAVINYANKYDTSLGLIPSRRQVDYLTGYTGFTTGKLFSYVKSKTSKVVLQRDHGGPLQGSFEDTGLDSIKVDARYLDLIHIDPFKSPDISFRKAIRKTIYLIETCLEVNPNAKFEVGTEQAIFPYSPQDLDELLGTLMVLYPDHFKQIEYAVVQSGTGLNLGKSLNTGTFNSVKLSEFIDVCKIYNVKTKEHNGDFLSSDQIRQRFEMGLDGLNVAPELGQVETSVYLSKADDALQENLFTLCLDSKFWKKWVAKDFVPQDNKRELIMIAGHYMVNTPQFKQITTQALGDITEEILQALEQKIHYLVTSANG